MPTRDVSSSVSDEPFTFLRPKLLSHKPQRQVVLAEANNVEGGTAPPCILKLFSPKAIVAFERELSVYSSDGAQEVRPQKLWSGSWKSSKYLEFLRGNLPSILRKSDPQVYVLVLSYVESIDALPPSQSTDLQIHAVKAALHSLRVLHSAGIVHGDVSCDNLLLQQDDNQFFALWIDFSSSSVNSSVASAEHEWQKAVAYFSRLVHLP